MGMAPSGQTRPGLHTCPGSAVAFTLTINVLDRFAGGIVAQNQVISILSQDFKLEFFASSIL